MAAEKLAARLLRASDSLLGTMEFLGLGPSWRHFSPDAKFVTHEIILSCELLDHSDYQDSWR